MEMVEGCAKQGPERLPLLARPEEIPFPPRTENIPKLETWLKNAFPASAFNTQTEPRGTQVENPP